VPAEVSDIPRQPSNFVYQVDILQPPSQLAAARRLLQVTAAGLQFGAILVGNDLNRVLMGAEGGKEASAQALQKLLTRLGPTFVKLAQTLSMRPDLVGDVYSSALTKLQDNVKPFPNDAAFAILEEELGRPAGEVFEFLSPDPVASASIGQVYRGILRPEFGGTDVAVKVQRPGASESIALDIFLLRRLLGIVQRAAGITRNLGVLADEIGVALRGECDFRNEVANSEVFQKAHAALGFITTPPAIPELCSRRVLVSQWIDGRNPAQLLSAKGAGASEVLSMVRMGIQCSLVQLLVTGCMHGDPHSGNLLLMPDGRLCYLDFGMIVRVSSEHRQAMMAALVHLGLGEWSRLVDDLDNLELLKEGTDKKMLAKELEVEFTAVLTGAAPPSSSSSDGSSNSSSTSTSAALAKQLPLLSLQTSTLSFSILASVLFRVAYKFRFLLPSYFPLVVRAVASLEGVALTVDPNFKLVAAGMPVVLNQLLSDRRPAAQALLRELLLAPGGALRTDETTRQILQVWLSAAKQEARAEIIIANRGIVDLEHDTAAAEVSASAAAVDMTSLLLDRKNVPLRKTLMMSNPAATVAEMPAEMRSELLKVLSEALTSGEVKTAASNLLQRSPTARAQRKRLWMLFKASVPKVLNSPPKSILQLITFTMTVIAAVAAALFRKWFAKFVAMWRQWFGGGKESGDQKPQTEAA
jgi:aarF domain-containing kinase